MNLCPSATLSAAVFAASGACTGIAVADQQGAVPTLAPHEAPSPAPESVSNPVIMRTWPQRGAWVTVLAQTTYDGPVCGLRANGPAVGENIWGLRVKDDRYDSLSLFVGGPGDELLASRSIKLWIDAFTIGEFPVTRRLQGPTVSTILAAATPIGGLKLIGLLGSGGRIGYAVGVKSNSASLQGIDIALKDLRECVHEIADLASVGATADLRQNWINRCTRAAEFVGKSATGCPAIWDNRAAQPQEFAEMDANIKALEEKLSRLPSSLVPAVPLLRSSPDTPNTQSQTPPPKTDNTGKPPAP
jgi:hypothetical protein